MSLTIVYDVLKSDISNATKLELIKFFDKVLGLNLIENNEEIPDEVIKLAQNRWEAKLNKNYALSDELRNKILNLGYVIKDSKESYEIVKN